MSGVTTLWILGGIDDRRAPDAVDRYLMLDSAPVFSLSSIDAFTEAIERAAALGFTDVVTHWPRPESWYAGDEAILDDVPAVLARYRSA
jgi:hypothetical protein